MNVFTLLATLLPAIAGTFIPPTTPPGRILQWGLNSLYPNNFPDLQSFINLYLQGLIGWEQLIEKAKFDGFQETPLSLLIQSQEKFLSPDQYIALYRRGFIDKDKLTLYFRTHNINKEEMGNYLSATEFFPSPADLIRFAVREVYTPDTVKKFGMGEDLPEEFVNEAEKAGVTGEQAGNYWKAHWSLPSPSQGFEMFHRDLIDRETLKILLKSLDIMPYWRDKIIDLSYNLPTRVDVRRMYRVGVISEEDVLKFYKSIGYSPKNAKALTDFTVINENTENLGLTKSSVEKAYIDDLISKEEYINFLKILKYSESTIQLNVDAADYKKSLEIVEKVKNDLIELYLMGEIDINGIRQKLLEYALPTRYIDRVINDVILEESKRRKVPSLADLRDWLNKGIISEEYFSTKMRLLGFKDNDIQNYLTEIAIDRPDMGVMFLKETVYQRWLSKGIMNEKEFTETLTRKGVLPDDIARLILETQE